MFASKPTQPSLSRLEAQLRVSTKRKAEGMGGPRGNVSFFLEVTLQPTCATDAAQLFRAEPFPPLRPARFAAELPAPGSPILNRSMPTKGFRTQADLRQHFYKHGADFACATSDQYERLADAFLGGQLAADASECTRQNGGLVRYNEITGEFGVVHPNGYIATYYLLRGSAPWRRMYFCQQCKKP